MTSIQTLTTSAEFEQALQTSETIPLLVFKHSVTCPISSRAHERFCAFIQQNTAPLNVAMVVVQEARSVSDEIATRLGIEHESPQAIFVLGGTVFWHDSHSRITVDSLENALQSITPEQAL